MTERLDATLRFFCDGLGLRETVQFSGHAADFEPFVPDQRIYRKA